MLHTVAPENMSEDERVIGNGYKLGRGSLFGAIPVAFASFSDAKWVIAIGLGVIIVMLWEAGGRLHDLCIRLRRTNILISSQIVDKN